MVVAGIARRNMAAALMLAAAGAHAQTPALPPVSKPPASVPYRWRNVVIRGGGFVSGLLFSPTGRGLVYARTDVGGAYRSDDGGAHWSALLDALGGSESSYLGIESMAVDPQDASTLYLAAGMYSGTWGGPSAIFRSSDRGRTFERSAMPLKMGGNEDGRGCGEKLAVDPHLGSILFFGSRHAGLWKSTNSGSSWTRVPSFPAPDQLSGPGEKTGITFVVFDDAGVKGQATRTIYVGSAQPAAGLYRSDDAGTTWRLIQGSPTTLFPTHAVLNRDGALLLSYNDHVGPNGITNGAIWKYSPSDGNWQDISPLRPGGPGQRNFGFGGIAIDPSHPETLMVTTIDRWSPHDTLFRSTDGGRRWKDIGDSARASATETPWVYWHHNETGGRGWMNDLKIDPFDSAHVLYTTGEGIWGSTDVTAADAGKPTHWFFPDDGLEETVPLALISPPQGAPLLSAVGDLGGFRHDDLDRSPADGIFTDPQLTTTSSIDFAALRPLTIARAGYGDRKAVRGGYSVDGGQHWKPFATEPPGNDHGGGHVALSANGTTVVWSRDKGVAYWTEDWGRTWTVCQGIPQNTRVIGDRVDSLRFYSFKKETGQLLESTDGARTFLVRTEPIAAKGGHVVLAAAPGAMGDLWLAAGDKTYHTTDAGISFVPLQGMTRVAAIGFGAAAPGRRAAAIYLSGFAAAQEGTFRSDDGGLSWLRIDDSDHQFGHKNDMTGDPRAYGRVYLATDGRGIIVGEPVLNLNTSNATKGDHE